MAHRRLFVTERDAESFLHHPNTVAWSGQFPPADQGHVADLLAALHLVSRNEFASNLRELLSNRIGAGPQPVGLFVERELRKLRGIPNALFKRTNTKHKRAFGPGPLPVNPLRRYDPLVGSEGIVSQLVSEICRQHRGKAVLQPGPDQIRAKRIRRFILVTDFIGSGQRALAFLQAAWKVESVKSWHSFGLMRFEVVGYAGTETGIKRVLAHPCRASVNTCVPCPTIDSVFDEPQKSLIKDTCVRHDPATHKDSYSLGFENTGALIAFAHGMPNNAPRVFYGQSSHWSPLFPMRVTADFARSFTDQLSTSVIATRLKLLRQQRLAEAPWLNESRPQAQRTMLILASLSRGPKRDIVIAVRCGLQLLDVRNLLSKAQANGWVNSKYRLTDRGHAQLAHAKNSRRLRADERKILSAKEKPHYYPQSLRAPKI